MKQSSQKMREYAIFATLSAFSAVFQLFHAGFQTQWGMWIDIVGVSWIIAFFLFGIRGGLIVATVGSIIITIIAPDTWLGALAKFLATVPMFLIPYFILSISKKKLEDLRHIPLLIISIILAILLRGAIMFCFNYFFALHIWIPGKTTEQLLAIFPWYIIIGVNAVQGILEVTLAWLLVFRFKLSRFAHSEE